MFDDLLEIETSDATELDPDSFKELVTLILEFEYADKMARLRTASELFRDTVQRMQQAHTDGTLTYEMVADGYQVLNEAKIAKADVVHSVGRAVFAVLHVAQA